MGSKVYVVAGENSSTPLDSIEMLNVAIGGDWHIFRVDGLSLRTDPAVSCVSDSEIIVMGGEHNFVWLSDALIINTVEITCKTVEKSEIKTYKSKSNSAMVAPGKVFSMVHDNNFVRYMIHYDATSNRVDIAKVLGK